MFNGQPATKYTVDFISVILLITEIHYNGHNTVVGNYLYPFYIVAGVFSMIGIFQSMITSSSKVASSIYQFLRD